MLLVSSRIWTRVAVSISYDDNDYTTGMMMMMMMMMTLGKKDYIKCLRILW